MREKISVYVDELFSDAALTIRNAEVQQEILQHTLDRYDDLIAAGKSEQEAYDEAVGGIGDVSELYEHKPEAEAPKTRDFPAPPTPGVVFKGMHWESPPPAAEPFTPIVGPPEGWRMAAEARLLRRPRPCTRPMVVVDLPSPRGVGVMAVTSTYLPLGLSPRRSSTAR